MSYQTYGAYYLKSSFLGHSDIQDYCIFNTLETANIIFSVFIKSFCILGLRELFKKHPLSNYSHAFSSFCHCHQKIRTKSS